MTEGSGRISNKRRLLITHEVEQVSSSKKINLSLFSIGLNIKGFINLNYIEVIFLLSNYIIGYFVPKFNDYLGCDGGE